MDYLSLIRNLNTSPQYIPQNIPSIKNVHGKTAEFPNTSTVCTQTSTSSEGYVSNAGPGIKIQNQQPCGKKHDSFKSKDETSWKEFFKLTIQKHYKRN